MIFRSGFLRAALASSGAVLLFSFAACGGKVIDVGEGDDSSNKPDSGSDAGGDGTTTACSGDLDIPVCPACDDPNSPIPQCVDGVWTCAVSKCVPPPPESCDTIPEPDCACGAAQCVSGQWDCPADCGGFCPATVDNLGGQPCVTDGLICGDECGDPCQPCNYVVCTSGAWQEVESTAESCDAGTPGR
jgi:hypothetical protein